MTNIRRKQRFYFFGAIASGCISAVTAMNFLANQSVYVIIIFSCLAIAMAVQYFRVALKDEEQIKREAMRSKDSAMRAVYLYRFPEIRESKFLYYLSPATPMVGIVLCILIYFVGTSSTEFEREAYATAESDIPSCSLEELPSRSICVTKFSDQKETDKFSQSLLMELSGKVEEDELRLVDHDKFVFSGRNRKQQLDSIQYMHCIDTGIIVHGMRSSEDSVFYCRINFLNYERKDTLIENPDEIEFSFKGHVKYLSNFLLAQNESSNKKYRYALDLFLEVKDMGEGDEFNSIVDYYIGNMYYNLNELDSARVFYNQAIAKPSTIRDYALDQLELTRPVSKKITISRAVMTAADLEEHRVKIISMFNNQFKHYATRYFEVKKRHEKEIIYSDFARLTPEKWDLDSKHEFTTDWIIYRYDSLYYFEMTTQLHPSESEEYEYMFSSNVNKKWSISTRGLRCIISEPSNTWRGGWNLSFVTSGNSSSQTRMFGIHYDWYYQRILSGREPYRELAGYSKEFEIIRVQEVENAVRRILRRARLADPINQLDYNDLISRSIS